MGPKGSTISLFYTHLSLDNKFLSILSLDKGEKGVIRLKGQKRVTVSNYKSITKTKIASFLFNDFYYKGPIGEIGSKGEQGIKGEKAMMEAKVKDYVSTIMFRFHIHST